MDSEGDRRAERSPPRNRTGSGDLLLIGVNHRTCGLDDRERFLLRATYARLRRAGGPNPPWEDVVLLTTCNRIEAYVVTARQQAAVHAVRETLGIPEDSNALYVLASTDAAAHLVRVASGLDSLAQGETQIVNQVRRAPARRPATFRHRDTLGSMFGSAARAASRVRRAANLGDTETSASHAAVRFIEASVHLQRPTVALLGSGKMARIAAASLRGRARIFVANRDPQRAREVAQTLGGRGAGLDALDQVLEQADVVLAATGSRKPLVSSARLRRIMARRRGRPLWIVDLGVPRNVAPACRALRGVTLVDIDGLAPWGAQPLPPAALARAESQIRSEAERLALALRPTTAQEIASFRKLAEAIRRREVEEALARLPGLSDADRAVVEKLAARLVSRFLHAPTELLRSSPGPVRAELAHELLRGIGEGSR